MSMLERRGGKEGDCGGRDREGREGRRWEACSDQDLKWGWGWGHWMGVYAREIFSVTHSLSLDIMWNLLLSQFNCINKHEIIVKLQF